jgi:probable addiction module antidote protein
MKAKTKKWDVAEHLKNEGDVREYLAVAFEDGDPSVIAVAIGNAARARGMAEIARRAGVSRESMYQSFSAEGNPVFSTVVKVLDALGLRFSVEPRHPHAEVAAT